MAARKKDESAEPKASGETPATPATLGEETAKAAEGAADALDELAASGAQVTFSIEALELLVSAFNAQRLVQGDEVIQMALVEADGAYTLAVTREALEPVETPAEDVPAVDGGE